MFSLIYNLTSFVYPAYASYKSLSGSSSRAFAAGTPYSTAGAGVGTQGGNTDQVERWLKYWSVVGCWIGVEHIAEWAVSWIPFYGIFKCIFFLWLTLPQTEGSTLIFDQLLAPTFAEHEDDIDAFLGGLRVKAGQGVVGVWGWLWAKVREQLNAAPPPRTDPYAPHSSATQGYPYDQGLMHQPPAIGPQPPTLQDPASGGLAQAYSLASRYALQYLPVAASALVNLRPLVGGNSGYTENIAMPVPRPTGNRTASSSSSGTWEAGYNVPASVAGEEGITPPNEQRGFSSSLPAAAPAHLRASSDRAKKSSSSSLSSTGEGDDGRATPRSSWGGASGYVEVNKEDAVRQAVAEGGSSWFGWGSPPRAKNKTE